MKSVAFIARYDIFKTDPLSRGGEVEDGSAKITLECAGGGVVGGGEKDGG